MSGSSDSGVGGVWEAPDDMSVSVLQRLGWSEGDSAEALLAVTLESIAAAGCRGVQCKRCELSAVCGKQPLYARFFANAALKKKRQYGAAYGKLDFKELDSIAKGCCVNYARPVKKGRGWDAFD